MSQENRTLKSFAFIFLIDLSEIKRVGSQLGWSGGITMRSTNGMCPITCGFWKIFPFHFLLMINMCVFCLHQVIDRKLICNDFSNFAHTVRLPNFNHIIAVVVVVAVSPRFLTLRTNGHNRNHNTTVC